MERDLSKDSTLVGGVHFPLPNISNMNIPTKQLSKKKKNYNVAHLGEKVALPCDMRGHMLLSCIKIIVTFFFSTCSVCST